MTSQLWGNSSVVVDEKHQVITYPNNAKVKLLAGPFSSFWSPTCFAKLVGPGLLSSAVIPFKDEDGEGSSYAFRPDQFEAAIKTSSLSDETTLMEIHPNFALRDPPLGFFSLDSILASEDHEAKVVKLTVSDDAQFVEATQVGPRASDSGRAGGSGTVLVMKICGALAEMGWGQAEVERVAKLVEKNVVSLNVAETSDALTEERLPDIVTSTLKTMLDKGDKVQAFVNVNSNEPVLLINSLGGLSASLMGAVTDEVVKQLHDKWNICPVRVYAGSYMESRADSGFSVSVLNVVNTDIGGPSMVQLLDAPCDAQSWNSFLKKEAWNGRELLGREEGVFQFQSQEVDVLSKADPTQDVVEEFNEAANTPLPLPKLDLAEHHEPGQSRMASEDEPSAQVVEAEPESSTTEARQPGEVDIGDTNDTRPSSSHVPEELPSLPEIQHPTWEHEDSRDTLLDMIRRQAQRLGGSSEHTGENVASETTPVAQGWEKTEASEDDREDEEASETLSPVPVVEGSVISSDEDFEVI